jgi:glycosyltransferase involved in cell wall biosynthesis
MRDVVIVPVYNRPAYLRICLEYLSRAEGASDKEIWVCIDRGKSLIREFYEVLNDFRSVLSFSTFIRPEHFYMGNSMNVLEAYKDAYQTDAKFVYLIEEDVVVQPDFFKWHEAVQGQGDFMCSVAYRCSRNTETFIGCTDPEAYFTTARDYASIGVCWRRTRLAPVVVHARNEYYENLEAYILKRFPCNRFCTSFTEQDGLIMRVMSETQGVVAWPYVPRAFHVGFAGYNRVRGPHLSYDELKDTIHNMDKVRTADRDFGDIEVVPTEPTPVWDAANLHCIQRFD